MTHRPDRSWVTMTGAEQTIPYDAVSGVGLAVRTWQAKAMLFVALEFARAEGDDGHDLTVAQAQARVLREALDRVLRGLTESPQRAAGCPLRETR